MIWRAVPAVMSANAPRHNQTSNDVRGRLGSTQGTPDTKVIMAAPIPARDKPRMSKHFACAMSISLPADCGSLAEQEPRTPQDDAHTTLPARGPGDPFNRGRRDTATALANLAAPTGGGASGPGSP